MASRYEVEVTLTSAKDLKNVNWRYGRLKPYVVVWVDPRNKCTSRVDEEGDMFPYWDQKLVIPLMGPNPIEDGILHIDLVHAKASEDIKPLIGSARLPLRAVVDEAGLGERDTRKLQLKRPSGRPHGSIDVKIAVRDSRYRAPDPYNAPPYGNAYAPPPPAGYPYSNAPSPYGQPAYGQEGSYGQPAGLAAPVYGYGQQGSYGQSQSGPVVSARGSSYDQQNKDQKKSKFGMGTGLAVGAVGGLLGGLAIKEGFDFFEDKVADESADRVEDDERFDDGGGFDGDDY